MFGGMTAWALGCSMELGAASRTILFDLVATYYRPPESFEGQNWVYSRLAVEEFVHVFAVAVVVAALRRSGRPILYLMLRSHVLGWTYSNNNLGPLLFHLRCSLGWRQLFR